MTTITQEAQSMNSATISLRHELLARLDELDKLAESIMIPDNLTLDQSYGAALMTNELLKAINAQKKAIRAELAKLL